MVPLLIPAERRCLTTSPNDLMYLQIIAEIFAEIIAAIIAEIIAEM